MKKASLVVIILALAGAAYLFNAKSSHPDSASPAQGFDGRNSSFTIAGEEVRLIGGVAQSPAVPGSASKTVIRYFGNEATGDLTNDGKDDAAFLVTRETSGSGVFYYVVAAIKTSEGYQTTNAFFVGDRIAPQSTEISSSARELRVNYADRRPGEPMTARPSEGKTLLLKVTKDGILEGLMK